MCRLASISTYAAHEAVRTKDGNEPLCERAFLRLPRALRVLTRGDRQLGRQSQRPKSERRHGHTKQLTTVALRSGLSSCSQNPSHAFNETGEAQRSPSRMPEPSTSVSIRGPSISLSRTRVRLGVCPTWMDERLLWTENCRRLPLSVLLTPTEVSVTSISVSLTRRRWYIRTLHDEPSADAASALCCSRVKKGQRRRVILPRVRGEEGPALLSGCASFLVMTLAPAWLIPE